MTKPAALSRPIRHYFYETTLLYTSASDFLFELIHPIIDTLALLRLSFAKHADAAEKNQRATPQFHFSRLLLYPYTLFVKIPARLFHTTGRVFIALSFHRQTTPWSYALLRQYGFTLEQANTLTHRQKADSALNICASLQHAGITPNTVIPLLMEKQPQLPLIELGLSHLIKMGQLNEPSTRALIEYSVQLDAAQRQLSDATLTHPTLKTLLWHHPESAQQLSEAITALHQAKILSDQAIDAIQHNPRHAQALSVGLCRLKKLPKLYTPLTCSVLMKHPEYAKSIANLFVHLHNGQFLSKRMMQLVASQAVHARSLDAVLSLLMASVPLTAFIVEKIITHADQAAIQGCTATLIKENNLLTQDIVEQLVLKAEFASGLNAAINDLTHASFSLNTELLDAIIQCAEYSGELSIGFQKLSAEKIFTLSNAQSLMNNAEFAFELACGLSLLHKHAITSPRLRIAMIKQPQWSKSIATIGIRLQSADLLTPANCEQVFDKAAHAQKIADALAFTSNTGLTQAQLDGVFNQSSSARFLSPPRVPTSRAPAKPPQGRRTATSANRPSSN